MDNEALIRDLLQWIADAPRPYDQVMEAWRTSCPRLSVWEDSVDAGFVNVTWDAHGVRIVEITRSGQEFLDADGPPR